jgi:tRNA(adenine34) deaminase
VDQPTTLAGDEQTMRRCFALAAQSARDGGYPFAAIVTKKGHTIVEARNRVSQERDVTRHAEAVALTEAQSRLACTSLDDCTLYANVEPCALCSYAIREARIARVVYGLSSPVMGGHSRWDILGDELLSSKMPEVFAPPPEIVADFLSDEAAAAFRRAAPMAWAYVRSRECFRCGGELRWPRPDPKSDQKPRRLGATQKALRLLRLQVFDRFGRGAAR